MLKTWEFGWIRITNNINPLFDTFIRIDGGYEYEYWQLASGEIIAKSIPQE